MGFFEGIFGGRDESGSEGARHIANPDRGNDPSVESVSEAEIRRLQEELETLKAKGSDRTAEDNDRMAFIENKLTNAGGFLQ